MLCRSLLFIAVLASLARAGGLEDQTATITGKELQVHINYLADDERQGRDAGSAGGRASADYIAQAFKSYGLEPGGDQGGYFQPFHIGERQCRNVIALLPGADEKLKDEYIVIGAHYDHVGLGESLQALDRFSGGSGKVHNGADDNASGTAGLMELAQAYAQLEPRPRRSIVLVAFDAEEQGLLGSRHYVRAERFSLERTVLMINMDMIGRCRQHRVTIYGAGTSPGLQALVDRCNRETALELEFAPAMIGNSDHAHFYRREIPVLFPFTGLHADYHRHSDDAHKIEPEPAARIVQLIFKISHAVAQAQERPAFQKVEEDPFGGLDLSQLQDLFGAARGRPRLGITGADAQGGARVDTVMDDSVAERAGLKPGDIITSFDEEEIDSFQTLREAVEDADDGAHDLTVRRGDETLDLTVKLKPPAKRPAPKPAPSGKRWH